MKITFVCGNLEPERDGVGDYTRRLAGELIRNGHEATAVSINDRARDSATVEYHIEHQQDGRTPVPVVRMSAKASWHDKTACLESILRDQKPDLVSLQYVPHGFHPKGLPFRMIGTLSKLPKTLRWHVMLHELWTEFEKPWNINRNVVSLAQRFAVRRLFNQLSPSLITTSNHRYKERLSSYEVDVLPIFSNIDPVLAHQKTGDSEDNHLNAVIFGAFSGSLPGLEEQLRFVINLGKKLGRKPVLNLLGQRPFSQKHVDAAIRLFGSDSVIDHGPLSQDGVSRTLLEMHLGISRADYRLFAKSGSTLAYLEHGLPVLLMGERNNIEDVDRMSNGSRIIFCEDKMELLPRKGAPFSGLSNAANRFLQLIRQ